MSRARAANAAVRDTRDQEQREAEEIHDTEDTPWVVPSSLAAPPPRPGMVQRWIRVASGGKDDAINTSRKFREGWKPRQASTVPKNFPVPSIKNGTYAGVIGVEGMLLCEMPAKKNDQRRAYIRNQIDKKTQSVDAEIRKTNLENANPAFGKIQKSDRTIPVRERQVKVADDTDGLDD